MVAPGSASRRTFLKGAGVAGVAVLAGPLLARTAARAATEGIILGANAPGAWTPPLPTKGWTSLVTAKSPSGAFAVGCRSYRDTPFSAASGCPTTFPGEQGSIVVASIKPDPTVLLSNSNPDQPALVAAIKALILDGMNKATGYFAGTPQLTAWHEAGNLYTDASTWGQYGVVPGTHTTINGVSLSAAQIVRSMHVMLQGLCAEQAAAYPALPRVEYGSIIYGDISQMASETDPTLNWVPDAGYPLDWYGIDVYYDGGSHPDLASYALVSQYLGGFLTMARNRSGLTWPKLNVCECNANAADDSDRPGYFENLALWLHNNGGRRMLTFFPTPAGPHSVTWEHVADATVPYTINALKDIQATYG
jgi:hypothetical protein